MKTNIIILTIASCFGVVAIQQSPTTKPEPKAQAAFEIEQAKLEAARNADPATRPHPDRLRNYVFAKPVGVNADGYARLEMGMTETKVYEILGYLSEEIASDSNTRIVQWTSNAGDPYYVIMAKFVDGRLSSKSR